MAGPSGIAHEGGPGETLLAGSRAQVLATLGDVVQAALDARAHRIDVRLEAPTESRREGGADRRRARRRAARPRDRGRARVLGVHARVARARRRGLRRRDRRPRRVRRRRAASTRAGSTSCPGSSTRTCTSSPPSSCPPSSPARVVPHGTTAVVTDPHEMANVLGRDGRAVDARGVRGPAARRVRDGAVVRAGERLRVARRAARARPTWRRSCAIRGRSAWPR